MFRVNGTRAQGVKGKHYDASFCLCRTSEKKSHDSWDEALSRVSVLVVVAENQTRVSCSFPVGTTRLVRQAQSVSYT